VGRGRSEGKEGYWRVRGREARYMEGREGRGGGVAAWAQELDAP